MCHINIHLPIYIQKGHTCLMAACNNGHLDVVRFFLSLPQVDVNARDGVGLKLSLRVAITHAVRLFISMDSVLLCMPVAVEISKSLRVSSIIQKWTSMQPV